MILSKMTLEEISEKINVSRTTIYKVINNKGYVSDETRKIVNEALIRFNYNPNTNARNLAMNKEYKIAYIGFKSRNAKYFSERVSIGMRKAVNELKDDGLSLRYVEVDINDPDQQIEEIDKAFLEGYRNFIIAPCDVVVIQKKSAELKSEGCNVIVLSRDVGSDGPDCYVGVDYYRSGALAAELLGKLTGKGNLKILLTNDVARNKDIEDRYRGFLDKIESFDHLQVESIQGDLGSGIEVHKCVSELLKQGGVDGLFDLSYKLDWVSQAIAESGKSSDVKLVGFDYSEDISKYIQDATIDAVVFQDIVGQAYKSVTLLFDLLCYGKPIREKKHYSKLDIVMAENMMYFTNE